MWSGCCWLPKGYKPMEVPVTVVTANATQDNLTDQDYRDIYNDLRDNRSLRQFVQMIGSQYSIAFWGKYEAGELPLTRKAKDELRKAVGLPVLPLLLSEAIAIADPDATVYQIGAEKADRVIMVGQAGEVTIRLNGQLEVLENGSEEMPKSTVVTSVTRARQRRTRKGIDLSPNVWNRLSEARVAQKMTWDQFALWLLEERG